MKIDPYCQRQNCSPLNALFSDRLRWYRRAFTAMGRQTSAVWGMRQKHSPDGSTAAAFFVGVIFHVSIRNKKAQLLLTNPRDAKACQKLLQFDVLTTLSLTILAYLHSVSCVVASEICEIPRNSLKIQTYRVQGHPRSSILVSMDSPYVTSY